MTDSPRWCGVCKEWGDHHTDRHVTTTDARLARELKEQGHDPCFVAEAQAAMQDAMDELGCS